VPPRAPLHWRAPAYRGTTPQAAFRAIAHAALSQVETNARGVLLSDDPEFLHQLRVGLRRLRSALRAFRSLLAKREVKRVTHALRKVTPKLGAARDWDVLVARLEAGGELGMLQKARRERDDARRVARRALLSKAFAKVLAEAAGLTVTPQRKSLAQVGASALARTHRKLTRAAQAIDWADAKQRHAVRIRVKRLRYGCEFFAPAFPGKRTQTYVAKLKELQDIFGELNDLAVGQRLLGFAGEETALLSRLARAWPAFERRRPFWRAAA
jgi:CHAD domain-containing protein